MCQFRTPLLFSYYDLSTLSICDKGYCARVRPVPYDVAIISSGRRWCETPDVGTGIARTAVEQSARN